MTRTISELQTLAYKQSADKGFHDDEPAEGRALQSLNAERIALMHSELSEALEELRSGHDHRKARLQRNAGPQARKEVLAMSHPAVAVYTKSNCMPCKRTKKELELRGVTYTEVDLESDPAALAYVQSLGHQQAPVVVVDTATQPVHWSGLIPALINLHFGKRPVKA